MSDHEDHEQRMVRIQKQIAADAQREADNARHLVTEAARTRELAEYDAILLETLAKLVRVTGVPVERRPQQTFGHHETVLERWLQEQTKHVGRKRVSP